MNKALKCFLHLLHFLNEPPSFTKDVVSNEEQKIHLGENPVCNPFVLIYVLKL